jgi:DNA-binding response OmpR family regulator
MSVKKILIIEDARQTQSVLKEVLQKEGYIVFDAYDGVEGVKIAKREIPDLILLDLLLPKISGFDICIKLREDEKTRKIPIIVISTLADNKTTHEKLKRCDVISFLQKPYTLDDLLNEIKRVLG